MAADGSAPHVMIAVMLCTMQSKAVPVVRGLSYMHVLVRYMRCYTAK